MFKKNYPIEGLLFGDSGSKSKSNSTGIPSNGNILVTGHVTTPRSSVTKITGALNEDWQVDLDRFINDGKLLDEHGAA